MVAITSSLKQNEKTVEKNRFWDEEGIKEMYTGNLEYVQSFKSKDQRENFVHTNSISGSMSTPELGKPYEKRNYDLQIYYRLIIDFHKELPKDATIVFEIDYDTKELDQEDNDLGMY